MESGVQSCSGHRTRTIKTDGKVREWKVGFRVAGDTEPGKDGWKKLRMESGVTGCGGHGRGWVRGEGGCS